MKLRFAAASLMLAALTSGPASAPAGAVQMQGAVLQGLDKITARISTINVAVGQTVSFGSLQITLRACDKHPPEETPESAAFLQIIEQKEGEAPVTRFSGWMFASSPGLNPLEPIHFPGRRLMTGIWRGERELPARTVRHASQPAHGVTR